MITREIQLILQVVYNYVLNITGSNATGSGFTIILKLKYFP